jgi:hypothetical protein
MREKLREDADSRRRGHLLGDSADGPDEDVDLAVRSLFALSVQLGGSVSDGEAPCGTAIAHPRAGGTDAVF